MSRSGSLFHYTTLDGCVGILESNCFYASEFRFLNDVAELEYAKHVFEGILRPEIDRVNRVLLPKRFRSAWRKHLDAAIDFDLLRILGYIYDITNVSRIFVLSFCRAKNTEVYNEGLLSQWRGYGADGGVAIQLDRRKLFDGCATRETQKYSYSGIMSTNCVYDQNSRYARRIVEERKEKIREAVRGYYRAIFPEIPSFEKRIGAFAEFSEVYFPFVEIATTFKHPAFQEESETRIVAVWPLNYEEDPQKRKKKEIHIRRRGTTIVPYIRMFEGDDLPIQRIIVGPHLDAHRRKRALEMVLENRGLSAPVHVSRIPYV